MILPSRDDARALGGTGEATERAMPNDLIDRRPTRAAVCEDIDDHDDDGGREAIRGGVWAGLGFAAGGGSPELSDHAAATLLIEATVARLVAAGERPTSTRTRRWSTVAGESVRVIESPTRSTRYGAPRVPARQVRAYLLRSVLGLSLAEVGRRIGTTKGNARNAIKAGAKLAAEFARTRTDPRRPSPGGRPGGKNERPW